MSKTDAYRFETRLVHAGEPEPILGAVSMPIFQSANFVDREEDLGDYGSIRYMRLSNVPNQQVLHGKLAALENAEAAVVASSGMAAISTAMLTVLKAGDHLLVQDVLYGGTHTFVHNNLPEWGIEVDVLRGDDPEQWRKSLRSNTKAVYVEAMTNPLLDVIDLRAVVDFAKEHDLVSMIDNTVASPLNFRPVEFGFDLCLHSCTKYLNGHSDIVAGAIVGSAEWIDKARHKLIHLGGSLDAHAAWLLQRGMKTLAIRLRAQSSNAQRLAEALDAHPAVDMVRYPGLPTDPSHAKATEFFDGYSALMSFSVKGGGEAAARVMDRLTLPLCAASFGGLESLITRPATTSHSGLTPAERAELGITDGLMRVSVGIEAAEDLIADFQNALE